MGWLKKNKYAIIISSAILLFLSVSFYNTLNPFIRFNTSPPPEPTAPVEFEFETTEIETPQTQVDGPEDTTVAPTPTIDVQDPQPNTLEATINQLTVEPETPNKTYNPDRFKLWEDPDKNKCTTDKEILIRDAQKEPFVDTACNIFDGEWYSPYDNTVHSDYNTLTVHHTVHLKETWDSGGWKWDTATRRNYANDIDWIHTIRLGSIKSVNQKSDKEPQEWMPENLNYQCEYLYAWVTVKKRWELTIDETEKQALLDLSNDCAFNGYTFPTGTIPEITIVFSRELN